MDDRTDLTPPPPPPPPRATSRRRPLLGRRGATAAVASGLLIGGIAGGYVITQAATPSPNATTTPGTTPEPSTSAPGHHGGDCGGGAGRRASRAEDQQVVATAIGISTTQLQTEETAGKTIAAIATEHNVPVSNVISALVASENAEIDQRVSSGRITAAEGAQDKTELKQRITDKVNGTRPAEGQPDPPGQR